MATAAAEVLPPEQTDIIELVMERPEIAFLNKDKASAFIARVREETERVGSQDVSTSKGRDEIRTMAAKVAKTKAAINKARLACTEKLRSEVAAINSAGNALTDQLEALADEVRKPLTEWEEAEKARVAACDAIIVRIKAAGVVTLQDTSASVRSRGREIFEIEITKAQFGKQFDEAKALKESTVETLKGALARLLQEDANREELEKLRREAAEREERDRQEREAAAAEERRIAAEREEAERAAAAERAEQERIERARQEAAEQAAREAAAAAQREIDEANRRAEEAERSAQAVRDEAVRVERERQEAEAREQEEAERRERNAKHRREIMGQIKADLIVVGLTEADALAAVKAMVAGKVRHVEVKF